MPDRILINDLLVRCIVGINPNERTEKQDVLINLALIADLRPAAASDDFTQAIDYRAVKLRVLELSESSAFFLVETLAERIAALCLEDPRIQAVTVRVEKPTALRFARSVGVEITRERGEERG